MRASTGVLCLASVLLVCGGAHAAYESVAFGVSNYEDSGECGGNDGYYVCCGQGTYMGQWEDEFSTDYDYDVIESWENGAVDKKDFAYLQADDNSPYGSDWADALMYKGHGWHSCGGSSSSSWITMGDCTNNTSTCSVNNNCDANLKSEIRFGDADLNAAVLVTCGVVHHCVWLNGGLISIRAGSQFNTLNGYHGKHYPALSDVGEFDDYLDVSKYNNIGEEWVIEMTHDIIFVDENCATHVNWASNFADGDEHFYNSGFRDFHSTGSGWTGMYYIAGCESDGGDYPLP